MASATMQAHAGNHQATIAGRPDGHLSVGCAPNSGYHHSLAHNQSNEHQAHQSQVNDGDKQNNHNYAAHFYRYGEQQIMSADHQSQQAAGAAAQHTQFFYQQQQQQQADETAYQQLYTANNLMPLPGEPAAYAAPETISVNNQAPNNQHYEHAGEGQQHYASQHHSYPFMQTFSRAQLGHQAYANSSHYPQSANQASMEREQLDYRQLSLATADQGHRSPIDSDQSASSRLTNNTLNDKQGDQEESIKQRTRCNEQSSRNKLQSHVLIELETTNKRQQERKTSSIGLDEDNNNNFQEVSVKRQRRKTNSTSSNKAINVTCNNTNEPNELTDNEIYNNNNNNVRDVETAQNVDAYANLANQHNQVKTEQNKGLKNNNLEDNLHNQHHHHSSFWSSNNIHHYNQLSVDLLHRPQQHQQYQQQQQQHQERVSTAQHNLTWFRKGDEQEEEASQRIDQLSAGNLQRADNFAEHTQHYQQQQQQHPSGHFHNKLAGYNTADYHLLAGNVARQNVAAGGRRAVGVVGGAEAEAADASELEVEELAAAAELKAASSLTGLESKQANATESNNDYNQLRILEMRKEKSRDAARSRRSKENHEFYELAKLLPLPAAITSQLDFLDKASIIRLTISFLKLRQFSVNGYPPWAPDFTTLGSVNPYSSQSLSSYAEHQQHYPTQVTPLLGQVEPAFEHYASGQQAGVCPANESACDKQQQQQQSSPNKSANSATIFDIHQGTHILQSLDGFAFAIGRDGRFLYISETVSMYLGLSQVEMTGSSVFDYTHQQDHEELARQLGIVCETSVPSSAAQRQQHQANKLAADCGSPGAPASVHSQYSVASNETMIEDYVNQTNSGNKRAKLQQTSARANGMAPAGRKRAAKCATAPIKIESAPSPPASDHITHSDTKLADAKHETHTQRQGTNEDPLVRQFCIRMKSTLTKRGCQHFKSSGYRVVHVVAHLRSYQSNDHGHLMDPLDELGVGAVSLNADSHSQRSTPNGKLKRARQSKQVGSKAISTPLSSSSASSASVNETTVTISDTNSGEAESSSTTTTGEHKLQVDTCKSHTSTKTTRATHTISSPSGQLNPDKIIGMVAVAIALPPPSINELRLESGTFVLRLNLELRVTHIEPKITELLHYPVELIAGRSLYSLVHPADVQQVQKCHRDLLKKGQMMSGYYRLLARTGGYIWIQSCATMICNNTYSATTAAAAAAAATATNAANQVPLAAAISPGLATPISQLEQATLLNAYSNTADSSGQQQYSNLSHLKTMAASPGLSTSHLSASGFEGQDQDQCVIFVNYLVTDIVDESAIVDVCQSSNYAPLANSFAGTSQPAKSATNNDNNTAGNLFNSPSSSCSSPCVGSMRAPSNSIQADTNFASPTQQNSASSLAARHQRGHQHHQHPHQVDPIKRDQAKSAASNGRRAAHKSKLQSAYLANVAASDENGHHNHHQQQLLTGGNCFASEQHSHHIKQQLALTGATTTPGVYSHYNQTPGSVNLALNKTTMSESSWLHQQAGGAGNRLLVGADPVNGAIGQHSSVVESASQQHPYAYKTAAFSLTDYNQQQQQQQQQQQHQQQPQGGYTSAASGAGVYPAPAATSGWDTTAATVAAVAAASANHHHHHQLGGQQQVHSATNPYAHLDHSHHQHHNHHHANHHHHHHHLSTTAAAAAAAAAAVSNHHNPANNYYNYYGYYGNKFI